VKSLKKEGARIKPQEVIEELDRQTSGRKEDVIISTGVGQHQMWTAQHYRWKYPRTMVTSGGLGVCFVSCLIATLLFYSFNIF
jgi:acetolactate synthase-1/2/3 large subunit